jgi:uncharacterized protein YkwD
MKRFALLAGLCISLVLLLASSAPALSVHAHGRATVLPRVPGADRVSVRVLAAATTDCVGADDPSASIDVQEQAMLCLINSARQQAGVAKLDDYRKLDGSADNKAADILRCDQFSHEACGRDFLFWFRRAGYLSSSCWSAGENLAWGTGSLGSARSIMKAWMRSPTHRANLLSSNYAQTGISLRIGGLLGNSEAHVWVNHFGHHC